MSSSPYVRWEHEGDLFTIVIDRPDSQNAMAGDMYRALRDGVRMGSSIRTVSAIVIRGVPGAFAVGGDLASFLHLVELGPEEFHRSFESVYEDPLPFSAILRSPKPVVAAIDGLCVAGGLLIAASCDLAIASDRSRFGILEARVGLADAVTAEMLVPSIGIMRTRYLALTGAMIDAAEAERWGLITRSVPQDRFEGEVADALRLLRRASPTAQRAYKKAINSSLGALSPEVLMEVAVSADALEGLRAFSDKRTPKWPSIS
jgi:enoyl-CoA hydratase